MVDQRLAVEPAVRGLIARADRVKDSVCWPLGRELVRGVQTKGGLKEGTVGDVGVLRRGVKEVQKLDARGIGAGRCRVVLELLRRISPVLAQGIGCQAVLDDAKAPVAAVNIVAEVARHVPVIGDLVIVQDHGGRDIGERAPHLLHLGLPLHDVVALLNDVSRQRHQLGEFALPTLERDRQVSVVGNVCRPEHIGPDQEVHRHVFTERHQVAPCVHRCELRIFGDGFGAGGWRQHLGE